MKFASLGSGSEGNALLMAASDGDHRSVVMLDCGFGLRETERRLQRLEIDPGALSAIFVTHEHQDHIGGVFMFARRYGVPVWLSYGTLQAVKHKAEGVDIRLCRDGEPVAVGALELTPYTVPHDAREPLQYVATDGKKKLGVLTDAGTSTRHMLSVLGGCDALLLEFNHDAMLLAQSSYPPSLKGRIGGPFGHLSNDAAAGILAGMDRSRLNKVVGAHLSRQNNSPSLARTAITSVLGEEAVEVIIACQDEGFGWLDCGRDA